MPLAHDPLEPYRKSQQEHGQGFGVTLWASPRSQQLRFRVFTEMAFLAGKRLLDAGCSRGDLAQYLLEHDVPFEHYVGIDGLGPVIDFARARNLPRCEFHCGDLLRQPDLLRIGGPQIILVSGTLNTMTHEQALALIGSTYDAASEALLFNFLSNRIGPNAPPQLAPARRLDTLKLLDWALSRCPAVAFRQDYFDAGHDATILMRKRG